MIEDLEHYLDQLREAFIERDMEEMEEIWALMNHIFRNIYSEIEQLNVHRIEDNEDEN